jgi:hypothetical protein
MDSAGSWMDAFAQRSRRMALAALGQLLSGHPAAVANGSIAKLVDAQNLTQSALDLLALHGSDATGAVRYRRSSTMRWP